MLKLLYLSDIIRRMGAAARESLLGFYSLQGKMVTERTRKIDAYTVVFVDTPPNRDVRETQQYYVRYSRGNSLGRSI